MIPKITQERPNVAPKYWCGTCGHALPPPNGPETCPNPVPWKFCSICGEPIEYDKAEPVRWVEQNCERCGRPLIRKSLLKIIRTLLRYFFPRNMLNRYSSKSINNTENWC